ncbi:SDE2 homolog [Babesia caballi]|uniref:SDE2 homolog n=1 Tax=Babesia caballi TaxID=5871 RepID=A0AAV4LZ49_BABCB|nr:SDE2 homolog [Babesia caballi]
MATYVIRLPNGCFQSLAIGYDTLCESAGCQGALFRHSCAPDDPCRDSIPCLSSSVLPDLVENHCGIGRDSVRVCIRGANYATVSYRRGAGASLGHTAAISDTTSEADCDCESCMRDNADVPLGISDADYKLKDNVVINVTCRLLGGKGGFGALLRQKGQRKKQSSNLDSCRTLTGERIRNVRLNDLAQRQREGTVDPAATKLPLPKETAEEPAATAPHASHLKHMKTVKKETKRVKSTVVKGLQNSASGLEQGQAEDRERMLEQALKECMDIYDLA